MKHAKRITAVFLAVLIIITVFTVSASAAQGNTPKEEVVYINLCADGSVKEINVVNIFDLDENGEIIDYGKYESLRNMTTTDTIGYHNDTVTIDADAGKLYYEGKLKENAMPWTISIKYFIDGKEYSADKIAGMSGRLEIKMAVRQNKECDSSFFKGYALQASFTLNTDNATNIIAEGATIANVGSDKQITYTILPNNEKDIIVSTDVKNFEMKGISINGIRMNLDIDIDDADLQKKIDEVIGAVNDLDKGAGKLNDGTADLYDATGELKSAVGKLHSGVGTLCDGADELKNGLTALSSKNSELTGAARSAYVALCTAAQTQLNAQLSANGLNTVTLTPETYSEVLLGVLAEMDADKVYNTAYNAALSEVTAQVEAQADTLYAGYIQSQANEIYSEYVKSQADSLYEQVATEAVRQQLVEGGLPDEQADAYIKTDEGKALVSIAVAAMTDEQKAQIIAAGVQSLTSDQKEQILQGAIASLSEEQKSEIRNGYIEQMMASEEVTGRINEAVKAANSAAAEVSTLKGQLDGYGAFCNGLVDYTNAVSSAADGAAELTNGIRELHSNTDTLKNAVGDLHIAVGTLNDGTDDLKKGTGEFAKETADMDKEVSEEINSMTSSLTGKDVKTVSFVSNQNTNIKSVQFVIQTESIEITEQTDVTVEEVEQLNFWQKLLRLFGLY
ncbi:MAG: hypothetical protein ACI4RP_03600 [Acutalibacteraceae bacterium]